MVNPVPELRIPDKAGDSRITLATSASQVQKYLGVPITAGTTTAFAAGKVQHGLSNISRAPLKPQQRMYMLFQYLLPLIHNELILTHYSDSYMKWLNRCTRVARSWLKFPKDTPIAYFHTVAVDGLGVPLEQTVPLMCAKRLKRLGSSEDPMILALLMDETAGSILRLQQQAKIFSGSVINTKKTLQMALAGSLHKSVDPWSHNNTSGSGTP